MYKNYFNNTNETCAGFDKNMVHGEYQKELLSDFYPSQNLITVGYPKHVEFYNNMLSKEALLKELKINKTILTIAFIW